MNTNTAIQLSKEFWSLSLDLFTIKQVKKLWELIQYHWDLYYNSESPIISDSEYDNLFQKLEALENTFKIENKQSLEVGAQLIESSFKKVEHSRPMISLWNTYNAEDLRDFDERVYKNMLGSGKNEEIEYMLEYKFDGLGLELIYKNGKFVQAITRGDGVQWEDVTQNAMQIDNIPKTIPYKQDLEVRGEVVMPISSFESYNENAKNLWEKVFSNPRNAASGSLRMKDNRETGRRKLKLFAYDISGFESFIKNTDTQTYSDMIHTLEKLGFEVSSLFEKFENISGLIEKIESMTDYKSGLDFEVDGLVLKVNQVNLWSHIWWTQHHPRYAIAYKFPAEIVTTKIESVEHSVGRTGTITPVANLEAVNIWWAMIRRATLHNYDETHKLWVAVWDTVFMKRAGEVIPKIISVSVSSGWNIISAPNNCPSCGAQVLKDESKVRYYCPNAYGCPAQMQEKLAFAVGKQGFNIDWFWEKQAWLFYRLDYITKFWDIFRLKNYRNEILLLDGFQEKSVDKLIDGIELVRNTDIVTFLKSLWIPGVGKKTAKTIGKWLLEMQLHLSWKDKWETERSDNFEVGVKQRIERGILWEGAIEKLQALSDIGPEVAESLVDFFTEQSEMIEDLLWEINIIFPTMNLESSKGKYVWKKMCITGSFDWYKRDQLAELLEQQGWEFMSSVSVKTDYLLAGEKAGSKLKKAQELWVEVLSLEEFLK